MESIQKERLPERALLVGLNAGSFTKEENSDWETLDELEALLETAGGECVGKVLQNRPAPDARTFIGEGKTQEIKELAHANEAEMIIFDNDLSPSQMRVLEELTSCSILDRSGLILDIFAQRARTNEGKLQVELAQYQYILPRLSGLGKTMSRLGGGIGTRGPGESKLESDRRHIRRRIERVREDLEEVKRVRAVQRRRRKRTEQPLVAIVGYTNAGKSTLLNTLTDAGIQANNRLFDTLDPTTRRFQLTDTQEILLSDTVGFIRKLPHHLINAFKATLEELCYADLLLHVVDISNPNWQQQMETVEQVICRLGAEQIPCVSVYNKADLCNLDEIAADRSAVFISAKRGIGMDELKKAIENALGQGLHQITLMVPYAEGYVLDELYRAAKILEREYVQNGTKLKVVCDDKTYGRMKAYEVQDESAGS